MTDAISQAIADVELEEDPILDEPDARPEGPLPEEEIHDEDNFSVLSWMKSIPEGSHHDYDRRDFWDPAGGGETRLAFHLSSAAAEGTGGYPNGLGIVVALAELYFVHMMDQSSPADGDDHGEDPPETETVSHEVAEGMV